MFKGIFWISLLSSVVLTLVGLSNTTTPVEVEIVEEEDEGAGDGGTNPAVIWTPMKSSDDPPPWMR